MQAIEEMRALSARAVPPSAAVLQDQALSVRRMCAAIRASLETHIRSEESELWPLFR